MDILKKTWYWILPRISPHYCSYPVQPDHADITDAVHKSLKEWQLAKDQFNYVEQELIDYMVYRINAAERHFLAVLSLARTQGVKAWPDNLVEPVKNPELGNISAGIQNPE